jgi:nucleoside-diphosphate-sugar epimerase
MAKYLITGAAAGFTGSNLAHALIRTTTSSLFVLPVTRR